MCARTFANNRARVAALVAQGGHTRASICDALEITSSTLANIFSQIRLTGQYPIEDDDRVVTLVDRAGYDAHQLNVAQRRRAEKQRRAAARKTPEQVAEALFASYLRAKKALDRAQTLDTVSLENKFIYALARARYNLAHFHVKYNAIARQRLPRDAPGMSVDTEE